MIWGMCIRGLGCTSLWQYGTGVVMGGCCLPRPCSSTQQDGRTHRHVHLLSLALNHRAANAVQVSPVERLQPHRPVQLPDREEGATGTWGNGVWATYWGGGHDGQRVRNGVGGVESAGAIPWSCPVEKVPLVPMIA